MLFSKIKEWLSDYFFFLLPIMQLFVVLKSQEMTYTVSTCGQDEVLYTNSQLCTELAVQFSMPVSSPVQRKDSASVAGGT